MKMSIPCCPLIKIQWFICLKLFWTVLTSKRCLICGSFSPDSDDFSHWRKQYNDEGSCFSWKQRFKVKYILMDLFITNMQLVDYLHYFWLIEMFSSAVWTLILTAPIHCSVMYCYISPSVLMKQTHLHIGWHDSEYIFISGFKISINGYLMYSYIKYKTTFYISDSIYSTTLIFLSCILI